MPYKKSCKERSLKHKVKVEVYSSNNNANYSTPALQCAYCDKTFKFTSEQRRHELSHNKLFDCKFCQKRFNYVSALKRHEKQHERTGKVPCEECGRSFRDETLLKRHFQYAHKGSFTCPECQATYTSESALATHSRTHQPSSERRYKCGFEGCHKTFNFPHHLKHHELTHCDSKQYFCGVCEKGFIQKHHLKCHLKTHESDARITCSEPGCGKKFATESSRKRHLAATHHLKPNKGEHTNPKKRQKRNTVFKAKQLCTKCGELIPGREFREHSLKCNKNDESPKHDLFKHPEGDNTVFVNERENERALEDEEGISDIINSTNDDYNDSLDNNYCKAVIGGCMANGGGHSTDNCLCTQMSKIDKLCYNDLDIEKELLSLNGLTTDRNTEEANCKSPLQIRANNIADDLCKGCECTSSKTRAKDTIEMANISLGNSFPSYCPYKDTIPKLERGPDNVIKLVDTYDLNITSFSACNENLCTRESNGDLMTMNSCKDIFGNCIVSGNDTMGEGCLCAKMSMESQHNIAQDIEEITICPQR